MKKLKELEELRNKDNKTLFKELESVKKKITEIQFKAAFGNVKNTKEIGSLKKKVARIWTILQENVSKESNK